MSEFTQHNATITISETEADMVEKILNKSIPFNGCFNVAYRTKFDDNATVCIDVSRYNTATGETQTNMNITVFDENNSFINSKAINMDTIFNRSIVIYGKDYGEKYIVVITIR